MREESLGILVFLSTGHAQINATDARRLATNHSSIINRRSAGDAPRRAIIMAVAANPCLSVSYAKALMNRLAETAKTLPLPI
jgi:hypothetical protein